MAGGADSVLRSLRIVWSSSPRWAVASGICVVLNALLPLALLWSMGVVVDATLAEYGSADGFDVWRVMPALVMFGLSLFGTYSMTVVSDWCTSELAERLRHQIAQMVHNQMARVDYQTMQSPQFQSATFRAISGSSQRPVNIFLTLLGLVESALTFCVMSVWLMRVSWWLPFVVILAGLPVVIVRLRDTQEAYSLYKSLSDDERKMHYYNGVLTQPRYSPEVRLYGLAEFFSRLFEGYQCDVAERRICRQRRSVVRQVAASVLSAAAVVVVFLVVILVSVSGGLSVGSLAMYLLTIRRAEGAVAGMSRRSVSVHSQGLYVRSLFEFLSLDNLPPRKAAFPTDFEALRVENVSFRYPDSDRQALSGVSFEIKRGEVVGLRGGNGTGKSTLVKLICGLLRPDVGSVKIGDVEVSDLSASEVSTHISAVFQDFRVYCASARENILFGDMSSEPDEARLREAAVDVGIDSLISSLPEGYDTQLGNQFKGSEMFSRGEWQRLARARVMYSRAEIVIFDEAQSALDAEARQTLARNICKLRAQGRTVIMVSHLSETFDLVDRVIDLSEMKK